jgi:hypothetical protein
MAASLISVLYQYAKLQDGHLRYLSLHPGTDQQPLECSVHMIPVDVVDFKAVSYVWGSEFRDQLILCDGLVLFITINLSSVLRRLRQPDAPKNLYVDLICINQEDLEEKGHQVAIMGQIYRRACRVLILIGSDDAGHSEYPHLDASESLRDDLRWELVGVLLKDVWFSRGWVSNSRSKSDIY